LLHRTRLQPDTRHVFAPSKRVPAAHTARLDAFPDGGISRVRLIGTVDDQALIETPRR
jgi:allantoicase